MVVWMGLSLLNPLCFLLLLGSPGLLFITVIAFSSGKKVTENCSSFLITSTARKGSLKQSLTFSVCVCEREKVNEREKTKHRALQPVRGLRERRMLPQAPIDQILAVEVPASLW